MLDDALLADLRCPETHQMLAMASAELVEELNMLVDERRLRSRGGGEVGERITHALVRADGRYAYPVHGGVPHLLVESAIALPVKRA